MAAGTTDGTMDGTTADDVFLYLTTVGRRSGLARRIEIWFVEHEGAHYVVAEGREAAGWVQNLTKEPAVRFSVGGRGDEASVRPLASAVARAVDPGQEPALARAVSAAMDAKYGWSDGLIVELRP